MAPKKPVNLKHSEIEQLLYLIEHRQRDGWYTGNKAKYEERERAIKAKLEQAARTKAGDADQNGLENEIQP
jgi:hypothetical protein